ncbi:hypothetical protein JZU46_06170 [bacterium]|nr:hypothetical protein [bacterium]
MTEYSGRTTAYAHKHEGWETKGLNVGDDCIQQHTIFEAQWSNCPIEVEAEVKKLWSDREFGNDYYYAGWDGEEMGEDYPIIHEYLTSRGITECLIHWWW